jgi:hypothetical protein
MDTESYRAKPEADRQPFAWRLKLVFVAWTARGRNHVIGREILDALRLPPVSANAVRYRQPLAPTWCGLRCCRSVALGRGPEDVANRRVQVVLRVRLLE